MRNLSAFGWNDFFKKEFETICNSGFLPGRIITEDKERYILITESGEYSASVSGRMLYTAACSAELPKAGDWVAVSVYEGNNAVIHNVLPRSSVFARKSAGKKNEVQIIAANIDIALVVQSLDNNFSLNRLERYMVMSEEGNIKPAVILNKIDLDKHYISKKSEVLKSFPDLDVFLLSAVTGDGLEQLLNYLESGKTYAFTGSSGVGKSTIINLLSGKEMLATAPVRKKDLKGTHTTTRRQLILLENGSIVIDTPGMREFHILDADCGLENIFPEIEEIALSCKFRNCTHIHETGCAVLQAVKSGQILAERFKNYIKLQKESDFIKGKMDRSALIAKEEKMKKIRKQNEQLKKFRKRNFGRID